MCDSDLFLSTCWWYLESLLIFESWYFVEINDFLSFFFLMGFCCLLVPSTNWDNLTTCLTPNYMLLFFFFFFALSHWLVFLTLYLKWVDLVCITVPDSQLIVLCSSESYEWQQLTTWLNIHEMQLVTLINCLTKCKKYSTEDKSCLVLDT